MLRKTVSGIILTLLLTSTLMLAINIQPAKASGTIYIRTDGSIDPSDAPISTLDNVTYTVTGNITSDADGIVVERDNIIIEGAGCTVQGTGSGTGIYLSGRSNVTVKKTNIKRFSNGIVLQGSNNNSISRNNITEIYWIGISSSSLSSDNIVSGNNIANNGYGISLSSSFNNIVSKNTVRNNGLYGITLSDDISINNTISENTMTNNNYNIYFVGGFDNTISRNNIADNTYGIFLHSSNNTISENTITNNEHGIWLNYPSNNKFYHNNLIDNTIQVVPHLVSIWDDGYPSGGNYWSDYIGVDADGDGIGDTPYVIDENNTDHYPLMHPWSPLPVHNINTGLGYTTIQEAINANETIDGHVIFVEEGTYYDNVVVNKTLSLIGENREATIIDGNGSGDAVTVLSNGTSLSSFTLQAPGFMNRALRLENVSSTTIVNNTLTNSFSSILLAFSDFNIIRDNNIAPGNYYSIFHNSSHNTLTRNSIGGLRFSGSFNNTLAENAIEAFWLDFSPNTKLRDNNFSYFEVGGDMDLHFIHDIDSSNMLNEKPIYYWVNRENAEVPSDAGYVALINCVNITVRGSNFENNFQSIIMFSTNNSRILDNNVTNINEGIWIFSSSNNIIYRNTMANNGFGIQLLNECSNNNIHRNNITANGLGIWLVRSSNNNIFHNNFINNGVQVNSYKSTNTWDDGHPSGGNYWSDYTGVDADNDGIGDSPRTIDANNTDRYPLVGSINVFDAGIWDGTAYNVDVVSNSTVSEFQFNPSEGALLRFNVTGDDGTSGFCRVAIPKDLLWVEDGWTIFVGGEPITDYTVIPDENYTYLYFIYQHSTKTVQITGTHVIPEFTSPMILPLLMLTTLIATVLLKKKRKTKPQLP